MWGRLRFGENNITVIYDSLGVFEDYNVGYREYTCTIKDPDSDYLVSKLKEVYD